MTVGSAAGSAVTWVLAGNLLLVSVAPLPVVRADAGPPPQPVQFREHSRAVFQSARTSGKPLFVLISASWCGWCRTFQRRTLSHTGVARYLNRHYVSVRVDADRRADLVRRQRPAQDRAARSPRAREAVFRGRAWARGLSRRARGRRC